MKLLNPAPGFDFGSGFGHRDDPLHPGTTEFHNGLDIKVPEGTPLRAPSSGVVRFSGVIDGASGNTLGVDADDGHTFWSFSHLSEPPALRRGDRVEAGDVVAVSGHTGRVTGPHLHFVVAVDHENVDPAPLIAGGGVGKALKITVGVLVARALLKWWRGRKR